jgi:hypothetical protein
MFNRKHLISELTVQFLKALMIILMCGGVIYFVSQKVTIIGKTLEEKRTGAVLSENKSRSIQKLKQDFETIGDGDELISNALIKTDDISSEFMNALDNLAAENNAKQTIKFSSPTKLNVKTDKAASKNKDASSAPVTPNNSNIYSISYTIGLTANVYDLIAYMEAFEKLPYFTEMTGVIINSTNNWDNDSTISIQAKLYAK